MEVEEHREELVAGVGQRPIEPDGEARGQVDDDVPRGDTGSLIQRRRHHARAHEALHTVALVLDEERREVELYLIVDPRSTATQR